MLGLYTEFKTCYYYSQKQEKKIKWKKNLVLKIFHIIFHKINNQKNKNTNIINKKYIWCFLRTFITKKKYIFNDCLRLYVKGNI